MSASMRFAASFWLFLGASVFGIGTSQGTTFAHSHAWPLESIEQLHVNDRDLKFAIAHAWQGFAPNFSTSLSKADVSQLFIGATALSMGSMEALQAHEGHFALRKKHALQDHAPHFFMSEGGAKGSKIDVHRPAGLQLSYSPQKGRPELDDSVLDKLMMVSVMPMEAVQSDGMLKVRAYSTQGLPTSIFRPAVYFALSTIVPGELLGDGDDTAQGIDGGLVASRPLVVMIPFRKLEDRVLNFWPFDTVVVGDIDLKIVDATILHPVGLDLLVEESVLKSIKVVQYGAAGKRRKVDELLKEYGYAVMTNYKSTSQFRWSVEYTMPDGRLVELGAGVVQHTQQSFGKHTADFLKTKYDGRMSFGPEVGPVLPNNATGALLPLAILTGVCESLKDMSAVLRGKYWRGWMLIGEYLFAMMKDHAFAISGLYEAQQEQLKNWEQCKQFFTEDSNYNGEGGVITPLQLLLDRPKYAARASQFQNDDMLARNLVPNLLSTIVAPDGLGNLYASYPTTCATLARQALVGEASKVLKVMSGIEAVEPLENMDAQVVTKELKELPFAKDATSQCSVHGWVQIFSEIIFLVYINYKFYDNSSENSQNQPSASVWVDDLVILALMLCVCTPCFFIARRRQQQKQPQQVVELQGVQPS